MSSTVFFEGASELATLTNTFRVGGTPTDPTEVTVTVTDPNSVPTTYTYSLGEVTKAGTGLYTKDIPCTIAGTWTYEWIGTVTASDVIAGTWEVLETDLGKMYCTIEALKSSFKDSRTTDDVEYHAACFAASRSLEQYCQRTFYRSTDTRTLIPTSSYCLDLPPFYDLVSVTSLEVAGATWGTGAYQLLCDDGTPNINAGPEPKPYVKIKAIGGTYPAPVASARTDVVEITGVWGWPGVPWAIKKAAEIIAAETFKLKDSPGMVAAGYEDFDVSMLGADAKRRFARFAGPYRRHAFMVA
jgi:hypothetical protein